jgi:uncharacterized protein (TIGR00297 family)
MSIAVLALYVVDDGGVVFEHFARPGDREDRRLYGLAGFSLSVAGVALMSLQFGMPVGTFVGAVLVVSYGNLAARLTGRVSADPIVAATGFALGGFAAALAGQAYAAAVVGGPIALPTMAFLAASGALLGALMRSVLFERDDPLVIVSVALLLWLFADLSVAVTTTRIAVALAVTVVLGYVSYALETASVPGMLTGIFLGLLTIVLGDYGWFAILIAFFGIGGLAAKFRFEEKQSRGVAQANEGARGSGNVLANSLTALAAVLAAAASPTYIPLDPAVFLFAFSGSVAAALSDTLSSELGGLFDGPRLITTFEPVSPGTNGAVTWQGELAGIAGAAVIAGIAALSFDPVGAGGATVIVVAGVFGMTVDSLLGATLEGDWLGNQGVNFCATLAAALSGGALAALAGVV